MLLRPAVKGRERGQIIVLFAMAIVVMLVFASMVVDVGLLRNARQNLVNTLDAAALAGGTKLPVDGSVAGAAAEANGLINSTIQANYPGLPVSAYTIAYKCVIGALPDGKPDIARDVPWVCDLSGSLGWTVSTSLEEKQAAFTGAGPTRVSNCNPVSGDKCNTVVITGSATQNYSFGRVVGINSGNTGAVVSVACNGPCGADPSTPVDVVLIMDRTGSMTENSRCPDQVQGGLTPTPARDVVCEITAVRNGADALLSVFDPALVRVALGTIGPSRVTTSGEPVQAACPPDTSGAPRSTSWLRDLASPANQVYGVGHSPREEVDFFDPAYRRMWIPVGFTGLDIVTPAVAWREAYSTIVDGVGVTNQSSQIWKAISCFTSYTHGTNLDTPVSMAATWLNTYGRASVKKVIILETDGSPALGASDPEHTCNAANNTARDAKALGIEIFTIGFGIGNERCPTQRDNDDESADWANDLVSTLLASMASPNTSTSPQHFWDAPDAATLKAAFYQIAISISGTGAKLIQLYPTPVITSLSPPSGTEDGGTTVTITGKFFTGATSVRFGGAEVLFTVDSDTSIRFTSPAGTPQSTVNVSVTTSGGTTPAVVASTYTYDP